MNSSVTDPLTLIAHRGLPTEFPENSLPGIQAALEAGAQFMEVDIQFTQDGIPVLYHDENMARLSGVDRSILEVESIELKKYSINLSDERKQVKNSAPIPTLKELVTIISSWPHCHFFLELKRQSIERHGINFCVQEILKIIQPVISFCTPISFNHEALAVFRQHSQSPIGWVIREWTEEQHKIADNLKPDYLFCNYKKLPETSEALWQGNWIWILYSIDDNKTLKKYRDLGFKFFETNKLRKLIK